MAVNLDGTFPVCRAAGPPRGRCARRSRPAGGRGRIVTLNSGAVRPGVQGLSACRASKGAGLRLTEALAQEFGPLGIGVNAVTPGHVETPFCGDIAEGVARLTGGTPDAAVEGFLAAVPVGRFGRLGEVAAAVARLVSDAAATSRGTRSP